MGGWSKEDCSPCGLPPWQDNWSPMSANVVLETRQTMWRVPKAMSRGVARQPRALWWLVTKKA